jgi:endoglucanase
MVAMGRLDLGRWFHFRNKNFVTHNDIKAIAALGWNTVRVPFNHTLIERDENPGVFIEEGFRVLDSLLAWCRKEKVYVVLDLHAAPGGQAKLFTSDPDKELVFENKNLRDRTVAIWAKIAEKYQSDTVIAGFDLLNEPNPSHPNLLPSFYLEIIKAIRLHDKNHMIILEGAKMGTDFSIFEGALDNNQIFSFHFYSWFVKDIKKKLDAYRKFAVKTGIPMWCGEWGENDLKELCKTKLILEDPDNIFCGNAFWTWKKVEKNKKYPTLNHMEEGRDWEKIINWISGIGGRPNPSEVSSGLEKFYQSWENQNLIFDPALGYLLNPENGNIWASYFTSGLHPVTLDFKPDLETLSYKMPVPVSGTSPEIRYLRLGETEWKSLGFREPETVITFIPPRKGTYFFRFFIGSYLAGEATLKVEK